MPVSNWGVLLLKGAWENRSGDSLYSSFSLSLLCMLSLKCLAQLKALALPSTQDCQIPSLAASWTLTTHSNLHAPPPNSSASCALQRGPPIFLVIQILHYLQLPLPVPCAPASNAQPPNKASCLLSGLLPTPAAVKPPPCSLRPALPFSWLSAPSRCSIHLPVAANLTFCHLSY